jgi:hypothetical protein
VQIDVVERRLADADRAHVDARGFDAGDRRRCGPVVERNRHRRSDGERIAAGDAEPAKELQRCRRVVAGP